MIPRSARCSIPKHESSSQDSARPTAEEGGQYSLAKILAIWALAAVPMGVLSWVVFPAVSPDYATDPFGAASPGSCCWRLA